MKRLIAKVSNAIRNRREEKRSGKIEVGKIYIVKHTLHVERKIKITAFNETWAEGKLVDSLGMELEEVILMRSLCTFKETKSVDE
jgi:hypothetical protein